MRDEYAYWSTDRRFSEWTAIPTAEDMKEYILRHKSYWRSMTILKKHITGYFNANKDVVAECKAYIENEMKKGRFFYDEGWGTGPRPIWHGFCRWHIADRLCDLYNRREDARKRLDKIRIKRHDRKRKTESLLAHVEERDRSRTILAAMALK